MQNTTKQNPPPKHYILSCGGTGGHLAPGIALAEALVAGGHRATLLISNKRVDARLLEKYPALDFQKISGSPFGISPKTLARFLATQTRGFAQSLRLVRRQGAAAIIGFGGFTTAAIILAGILCRIPVVLHEANRVPGRAIRLLGRFAKIVYLPPGVTDPKIPAKKTRHAALPVRAEIQKQAAADAREKLGLDPNLPVLSVFGGSQGAAPLNNWAQAAAPQLAAANIQLYVVTGLNKLPQESTPSSATRSPLLPKYIPFTDQVAELLSASDLVIARAGAGTLAELARCETPSVLIPYPQAADDHQRANAEYFERQAAAAVLDQSKIADLTPLVLDYFRHPEKLEKMRNALRQVAATADPLPQILADLGQL